MQLDRRTLIRGLSTGALAGLGTPAFGGLVGGDDGPVPGDDQLPMALTLAPERLLPGGMLQAYARNRQNGVANLITESFLVHMLSLTRRRAQQRLEAEVLMPALAGWVKALLVAAAAIPDLPDQARDTLAVLGALQGDRAALAGRPRALAEYDQVIAAQAIAPSRVTGVTIDFTQFTPRAGYAGDPLREAYFRTFRYAGALAFLLVPAAATGVSEGAARRMAATAVALSRLTEAEPVQALARPLFAALETVFGPCDDFGPFDAPAGLAAPAVRRHWVDSAAAQGRVPQVIDVIYQARRLHGRSPGEVAVSWRLLPGRRLADIAALQSLVYPATGVWSGAGPAPFDIGLIDGQLVKAYVGLDDALALTAATNRAAAFDRLGEAQLRARQTMPVARDVSVPVMRLLRMGQAGGAPTPLRQQALASAYVHHRHATALVAKQSYAAADKAFQLPPARPGALLASTPHFVRGLTAFAEGFAQLFPDPAWDQWSVLLGQLEDIAWLQQRWGGGTALADRLLNALDLQLAELIDPVHDRPIVTDIHTSPAEGMVVEIGLGRPCAVTSGDAMGAVLPVCQFKRPLTARLTDEAWAEQLARSRPAPAAPGLPPELWTPRSVEAG